MNKGGWTIVDDGPNFTVWSFSPPDHPAHPAAVKRVIVKDEQGYLRVQMTGLCQAAKSACDKVMAEFRGNLDNMAQEVRSRLEGAKK